MVDILYVKRDILEHPRTLEIRSRFRDVPHIVCKCYTKVFNPKAQNIRLQERESRANSS